MRRRGGTTEMRRRLAVPAIMLVLAGCGGQAIADPPAQSATPSATDAASGDPSATASAPE